MKCVRFPVFAIQLIGIIVLLQQQPVKREKG